MGPDGAATRDDDGLAGPGTIGPDSLGGFGAAAADEADSAVSVAADWPVSDRNSQPSYSSPPESPAFCAFAGAGGTLMQPPSKLKTHASTHA